MPLKESQIYRDVYLGIILAAGNGCPDWKLVIPSALLNCVATDLSRRHIRMVKGEWGIETSLRRTSCKRRCSILYAIELGCEEFSN